MVEARGSEKNRFHFGAKGLGSARQQNVSNGLSACRTARFARYDNRVAPASQILLEKADLGRLTSPLAAFECDEESPQARLPVS